MQKTLIGIIFISALFGATISFGAHKLKRDTVDEQQHIGALRVFALAREKGSVQLDYTDADGVEQTMRLLLVEDSANDN